jgi:hypothetical protein
MHATYQQLYLQPLKKGRVLPDAELALIFSTLPTLLSINKSLLDAVQDRVNACHGLPDEDVCIGDLFLQHVRRSASPVFTHTPCMHALHKLARTHAPGL